MGTGFYPKQGASLGTPMPPVTKPVIIPAPMGGINAVDGLASLDPKFCLEAVNLITAGRSMDVRPGYQAYATSVGGGGGVRAVMPFEAAQTANNRLFATASDGIYNVTSGGAIGAAAVALSAGATTGYGVWNMFVADNSSHYMFYADPTDGLYRFVEAGAWAAVTDITGVSELALVFCMQFKGRMWFAENNSARGWYLASGAISGAATRFDFGNKFNHGGRLVGLYSWTVDGGEGVDDHLVAISSAGDVMVYKGDDPSSSATWALVGQYYIGAVPALFRVAAAQGGDLYMLSQYGVIPLTRLMQGTLVQQEAAQLSRNIAPLIAATMSQTRSSPGWEMRSVPGYNVFLVATPEIVGQTNLQYCLSTRTEGWTVWNDLPYLSGDVYLGNFYFGDDGDTLYILTGYEDNVDTAGAGGVDVTWSLLTSYQDYGEVGAFHRAQLVRVVFTAASVPGLAVSARYDYDFSGPPTTSGAAAADTSLWDVDVWDGASWGASTATFSKVFGCSGLGRAVAVSLGGSSNSETSLIRMDLMLDTGGLL